MNCCVPAVPLLPPAPHRHPGSRGEERQHSGHRHRGRSQHAPASASHRHHSGEHEGSAPMVSGASWWRCSQKNTCRCAEEDTKRKEQNK